MLGANDGKRTINAVVCYPSARRAFWNGRLAMDPHDQFWTEEAFRYMAECRRLARLARKPPSAAGQGAAVAYRHWIDWLGDIQAQYINPPRHRPQFAVNRLVRRQSR